MPGWVSARDSAMARYGRSLACCNNALERELYRFMCTTKKECGSLKNKAEWMFLFPGNDWTGVFHPDLDGNPMFEEFQNKTWTLGGNLKSHAAWYGKKPKLDKRFVARLYVLMWRIMEADKKCKASEASRRDGRTPVSEVVRRMEEYFNPIMERVRKEMEMNGS